MRCAAAQLRALLRRRIVQYLAERLADLSRGCAATRSLLGHGKAPR